MVNKKDIDIELNIDPEFWDDFIFEASEHIEAIEMNVLTLEKEPEHMEIIHTMFRAFHTIKGLSGFVEHTVIQEIAHKTETIMDGCRKGERKVTKKIIDAILKSSDYIKQLCEDVDSAKDKEFLLQIFDHIEALELLETETDAAVAPAVPEAAEEVLPEPEVVLAPSEPVVPVAIVEPVEEVIEAVQDLDVKTVESRDLDAFRNEDLSVLAVEEVLPVAEPVMEVPTPVAVAPEPIAVEAVKEPEAAVAVEKAPVAAPEKTEKAEKKPVNEEYMKVAISKIDHLVDMIGELIINQSLIEQYVSTKYANDNQFITNMTGLSRTTRELQDLSMFLRMVSLKPTFQKVTRVARDTIQDLGKNVEFVTEGDSTEIDRVVTDKLLEPLVHLIKNAISHGIEEDPQDRVKYGKPAKARVELNAYNKRGKIYIEVKDDGRGVDTEVVYQKALEKGIVDPKKEYSDAEIREFILLPGFSTAKQVDNISGRGVGMDVVKTQVTKTGGKIDIKSELHKGSTFTLEIPVNHAIMNGTIIDMNGQHFIVPTLNVKEILQPKEEQWIFTRQRRTMLRVRESIIPIVPSTILSTPQDNIPLVLVLEVDQEFRALPINNVLNRQEVVVKPVGEEFAGLKYISGMSILGDGKVSLILDIDYLFKMEGR